MEESTSPGRTNMAELAITQQRPLDLDADLRAAVEGLGKTVALEGTHPRAEILMPPEEQLQVRLVKLDDVLRLQEASSDENLAAGAFWALTGGLLGIGVNLVTGEATSISKASWVAIGATTFFLIASGLLWLRFHLRSRESKKQLSMNLTHG